MSGTGSRSARRGPLTLRRTLVVGIGAVVALVMLAVGIVSVVTLTRSVTTVVDAQLTASMSALENSVVKYRDGRVAGGEGAGSASGSGSGTGTGTGSGAGDGSGGGTGSGSGAAAVMKPLVNFVGHGPGSVIAIVDDGTVVDSALFSSSDATVLDAAAERVVASVADDGTQRTTADLPGLGTYRFLFATTDDGDTLVAGISLATAEAAKAQQTILIVALAFVALALTIVGTILVVRLALRPLERVARAASEVATIPLDKGEVRIETRAADTDPRTEAGKVGEALNRLLDHVDAALAVRAATDKRMRRFVTDASHELRTPLAAIQGYAELTRQDADELPVMTEHALARIESEAKRMSSLVSDLLLLARLDEGQDLHVDEVDLSDLVVNAVSDANASAPLHEWVVEVPESTVLVTGDRERLHQLLVNLLSNAGVHTPEGSVVTACLRVLEGTAAIVTGAAPGVAVAEVTVTDDGPGIPAELLPELFDRFARGDASRSRRAGGAGLGLAIALSIVEAHSGHLEVSSSPAGSRFRILLSPATSVPATDLAVVTSRPTDDARPTDDSLEAPR